MTTLHLSYLIAFAISMTGFVLHQTHLISTLLCLEGIMLSLFITLSMWPLQLQTPSMALTPLLMLAFSACEAGTGLSLLVTSSRTHGSNLLQNLNLLQC
uniref:NADH-ubiquinone oxidoreductase chain 4L n=1 Tax=Platemys platycephala TaxID=44504 RepID=A0A0A6ZDW9_PLAPL|nr:NADH dehydrogenase subunit 4L [Platemys platycephala]AGL45253.1 NADH dehydrogenase subunit 4L [Platemys platycephala]